MSDYSKPIYVVEEVAAVVAAVAARLATPVYYFFGHLREITTRFQELTNSTTDKDKMFPCVVLFTDIPVRQNQPPGTYGTASLNLIIANFTQQNYTAQQRLDNNFKPVLYPIKKEFFRQMERHLQFTYPNEISYTEIDRYYYGATVDSKNQFNDFIDCIEIQNLQVIIKNKTC